MNCEQARETLLEALAGPVDAADEGALEEHLTSCARCGEEATGLRETWRSLAALEAAEVPSDRMRIRFRAALGAYEAGVESSWRARLARLYGPTDLYTLIADECGVDYETARKWIRELG